MTDRECIALMSAAPAIAVDSVLRASEQLGAWGYQMRRAAAQRPSSWRFDSWSLRSTAEA